MEKNKTFSDFVVIRVEEIEQEYAESKDGAKIIARQETLKNALLQLVPEESRCEAEDYMDCIWGYVEDFNEYIYKRAIADAVISPDFYKSAEYKTLE